MPNDDYLLLYLKTNPNIQVTKISPNSYGITTSTMFSTTGTTTVTLPPGYSLEQVLCNEDVVPSKEDQKSENYYIRKGKVLNKPTGLLAKLIRKV